MNTLEAAIRVTAEELVNAPRINCTYLNQKKSKLGDYNDRKRKLYGVDRIRRESMNLKIREFKLTLENYIAGIDLPPEVKRIVMKEIYDEAAVKANDAISAEFKERNETEKEESANE